MSAAEMIEIFEDNKNKICFDHFSREVVEYERTLARIKAQQLISPSEENEIAIPKFEEVIRSLKADLKVMKE